MEGILEHQKKYLVFVRLVLDLLLYLLAEHVRQQE